MKYNIQSINTKIFKAKYFHEAQNIADNSLIQSDVK